VHSHPEVWEQEDEEKNSEPCSGRKAVHWISALSEYFLEKNKNLFCKALKRADFF